MYTIMSKINLRISVPVVIIREGRYMVAYCPALDLSSYGDTEDDAKRGFEGAVRLFFEETSKRGTLERELLRLGWSLRLKPQGEYLPPESDLPAALRNRTVRQYRERVLIPCTA